MRKQFIVFLSLLILTSCGAGLDQLVDRILQRIDQALIVWSPENFVEEGRKLSTDIIALASQAGTDTGKELIQDAGDEISRLITEGEDMVAYSFSVAGVEARCEIKFVSDVLEKTLREIRNEIEAILERILNGETIEEFPDIAIRPFICSAGETDELSITHLGGVFKAVDPTLILYGFNFLGAQPSDDRLTYFSFEIRDHEENTLAQLTQINPNQQGDFRQGFSLELQEFTAYQSGAEFTILWKDDVIYQLALIDKTPTCHLESLFLRTEPIQIRPSTNDIKFGDSATHAVMNFYIITNLRLTETEVLADILFSGHEHAGNDRNMETGQAYSQFLTQHTTTNLLRTPISPGYIIRGIQSDPNYEIEFTDRDVGRNTISVGTWIQRIELDGVFNQIGNNLQILISLNPLTEIVTEKTSDCYPNENLIFPDASGHIPGNLQYNHYAEILPLGGESCTQTCQRVGMTSLSTSPDYYLCAASNLERNRRPGFQANNHLSCISGFDGVSEFYGIFTCACGVGSGTFTPIQHRVSCESQCAAVGKSPISPSVFDGGDSGLNYCYANTGGYGPRPGFEHVGNCNTGFGKREIPEPNYGCACD